MRCKKCGFEWKSYGENTVCPDCATSAALTHNEQQSLWESAHEAEKIKDFALRASCFLRLAELGDKRAQYAYAECLYSGVGVSENREEAALWYKAAARHMYPAAAYRLALCLRGKKGRDNTNQVFFWLQVAAEFGELEAQYTLAHTYEAGDGIAPSHLHCIFWLTAAAEGGHRDAIAELALMYATGSGVEMRPAVARGLIASLAPDVPRRLRRVGRKLGQGPTEDLPIIPLANREGERLSVGFAAEGAGEFAIAANIYFLAAKAGNAKAQYQLGLCYEKGNGVPASVEEARRRFRLAAKAGLTDAELALGRYAAEGIGGDMDPELALRSYTAAAEKGNADAAFFLGHVYGEGTLAEANLPASLKWYEKAAEGGNKEAAAEVKRIREATAAVYEKGRAAEKNGKTDQAFRYYTMAAGMGHYGASYFLGLMYENGTCGKVERKKAAECYTAAAAGGNLGAILRLGLCYSRGFGIKRDYAAATRLLSIAAKQNVEEASKELQKIKTRKYLKAARRCYATSTVMYRRGDVLEAIKFRNIAAKLGNARAMYLLGCHFDFGDGLPMDKAKASAWFARAAKAGYVPSGNKDLKNGFLRERKHLLLSRHKH